MTCPKSYVYDQLGSKPRGNLYYLKYEADKAIAEKDKEIAELKEQVSEERSAKVNYKISANDLSDGLKEAYAEIKHHKYRRCLAMAKRCKDLHDHYKAEYDCDEGFGDGMLKWIRWATKWQKRWLAIAEEFKEAGK